jgi:hypothetical protein
MFSDDVLMNTLVLKGGNALTIAHKLESRTSIDVDLSMPNDFDDIEDTEHRLSHALTDRFESNGLAVFDFKLRRKPENEVPGLDPRWGGYTLEFKLTEREQFVSLRDDKDALRRGATIVGPNQQRVFRVDISKHEFCEPKTSVEVDDYTVFVYTLPMIAIEKLPAICQQLPEYLKRGYQTPRARDFLDIHNILKDRAIELTEADNLVLFAPIFEAKNVPLALLFKIQTQREFHRADWDSVVAAAAQRLEPFDYYFDFTLRLIDELKAAGIK